jgi:diguanylate cyclase (GGDEF)-like protein
MARHAPRRRKRAWDDVPLRPKLALLLALATTAGIGLGVMSQHTEHRVPLILGGLSVLACALILLAHAWVQGPIARLVCWLDVQSRAETPLAIKNLPIEREDEIGRMAKAIYQIALTATRNHYDAQQLRRTLDHRVRAATAKATMQLRSEANRDVLTQLGNRRLMDEQLDPLIRAARQSGTDLVCLMFDMDRFKQVNDQLGHAAGDEVLQLMANLLRSSIRHDDLAVRLGGDEFVVLMPGGTTERAVELADSTRALFRQQSRALIGPTGPQPDLSTGVAALTSTGAADGKALLERADAALYQAKEAGRGRTVAT